MAVYTFTNRNQTLYLNKILKASEFPSVAISWIVLQDDILAKQKPTLKRRQKFHGSNSDSLLTDTFGGRTKHKPTRGRKKTTYDEILWF